MNWLILDLQILILVRLTKFYVHSQDENGPKMVKEKLKQISERLKEDNLTYVKKYFDDGKKCFQKQCYRKHTKEWPIYVRVTDEIHDSIGNRLGSILNDYACAIVSGAHFILIRAPEPTDSNHHLDIRESILGYIPHIVPHPNPSPNVNLALEIAKKVCKYETEWEWEYNGSDALLDPNSIRFIRRIVYHGVTEVAKYLIEAGRFRSSDTLLYSSLVKRESYSIRMYPAVSDVAIHYRCSDNIRYKNMGLLPFPTITSLIPQHAKTIYIHTEGTYPEHICSHILRDLFEYVSAAFPNALVALFAKENVYATMYNFIESRLALICSASTFCLHTALGKQQGKVYIAPTMYRGKTNFSYEGWTYLNFTPRTNWPVSVLDSTEGRRYILDALRNLDKYFSSS